jgi:hypothetical protein
VQFVHSKPVIGFITLVVIVDVGVAINIEPNPPSGHTKTDFELFAQTLNIAATVTFTVEALLRIHAMTLKGYIKSGFNQLDLIVVLTSWLSILLESFEIDLGPIRAFRVLRILKEFRYLGALQAIMGCLSYNIGFILTLLSFVLFFVVVRNSSTSQMLHPIRTEC